VTEARVSEAKAALRRAQEVLAPHPTVAAAGFLHDAEKEYAEAQLTVALIDACNRAATECRDHSDRRELSLPAAAELGVGLPAWLNGLAEAATELRRHLLDRLRSGELAVAELLLRAMEDVYDVLVTIDYPDAVTGGLRRSTDALRGVLERSRGDLTLTLVQARLQAALQQDAGTEAGLG
jgi:translin